MHVVRQTAFYCRTCKNYAKLWLMHARVFERESKTNNEHTVAVLCQRHDFILSHHLFVFVFLFFNQKLCISFCSSFYYCTWPKWLIYPTTTLIPGTTSIQEGRVYILKLFPLQKVLSPFLNNHEIRKKNYVLKAIQRMQTSLMVTPLALTICLPKRVEKATEDKDRMFQGEEDFLEGGERQKQPPEVFCENR